MLQPSVSDVSRSACVRAHGGQSEHILQCFNGSVCVKVNAENFSI